MKKRTRLWVDPSVQGALIVRVLIYWFACMIFVTLPLALIQTLANPGQYLYQHYLDVLFRHWPILAALTAMIPLFIYDTILFSHRFAGPISRLRRELGRYEQGERIFPIAFRKGDFWRDLVDRINNLVERAETAERRLAEIEAESARHLPVGDLPDDVAANEVPVGEPALFT
jgi:hypothetical protein